MVGTTSGRMPRNESLEAKLLKRREKTLKEQDKSEFPRFDELRARLARLEAHEVRPGISVEERSRPPTSGPGQVAQSTWRRWP